MGNFWVVYGDSNPAQVRGFFATEVEATTWRDANYPGEDVKPARIDSYQLVTVVVVPLP